MCFPSANSLSTRGIDQANMNTNQAIKNAPPPFSAATRGKRQMFPVPTAMPMAASRMPQRELNWSFRPAMCVPQWGSSLCRARSWPVILA